MTGKFSELTVLIVVGVDSGFYQGYMAVDEGGYPVWYYQNETQTSLACFDKMSDGNFLINPGSPLGIPTDQSNFTSFPQIISPLGTILYSLRSECKLNVNNIGVKNAIIGSWLGTHSAMEDVGNPNKILFLGLEMKDPYFNQNLLPPGVKLQMGDTIRKWNPSTGKHKTILSMFDILDATKYRSTLSNSDDVSGASCNVLIPGQKNDDWIHANNISRFNEKSNYFVSLRNTSSALIIDPKTFKVLYKFGIAEPSDFRFVNPDDKFYNQHFLHALDEKGEKVLMFDDGSTRPQSEGGPYARGLELKLDYKNKTITKIWEFRPETDLYCQSQGSAFRLNNQNTLLDFGAPNLDVKYIYEVRPDSSVFGVLSLTSSSSWYIYRAIPLTSIYNEIKLC
jgi:hypothetical protein